MFISHSFRKHYTSLYHSVSSFQIPSIMRYNFEEGSWLACATPASRLVSPARHKLARLGRLLFLFSFSFTEG